MDPTLVAALNAVLQTLADAVANLQTIAQAIISGVTTPVPDPTPIPSAVAPVNNGLPTISGTAQQGDVLTGNTGTWTGADTFAGQWEADGAPISGATASTYTPVLADIGKVLTYVVTATGGGLNVTASSAATSAVTGIPAPVNVSLPTITGTAQEGQTLTGGGATWTGATTFARRWLRNGVAISGATSVNYVVTSADIGAQLSFQVTAGNTGPSTTAVVSAPTATVIAAAVAPPPAPANTALPTISGVAQQGNVLTGSNGTWTGATSYAGQWNRNGTAISGATGATYTLGSADVGDTITYTVTATGAGGSVSATSAATATVTAATTSTPYVMPDQPIAPTGPYIAKSPINLDSGSLTLSKVSYAGDYISIDHSTSTNPVDLISITDATTDSCGSIYYTGASCNTTEAAFTRLHSTVIRSGRPHIRLVGSGDTATLTDIYCDYDPTPNIHTGDIATGVQCGRHPNDGQWNKLVVRRMFVQNIYCGPNPTDPTAGWQPSQYWNGDGITAERNLALLDVAHVTCKNITDGAVDSKARTNLVSYLYAENIRQALKLWDDSTCDHVTSINPVVQGGIGGCSHTRLMGAAPVGDGTFTRVPLHNMTNMYCVGSAALVRIENGPVEVHMSGHYEGPTQANGMPSFVKANGGSLTSNSTWNGSLLV